jgi:GWxTD domain-containing protein
MKNKVYKFHVILLIFFGCAFSFSQPKDRQNEFFVDALSFFSVSKQQTRLDVYIEIPFTKVEFKKSKEKDKDFYAQVDITVDLKSNDGTTVYNNVDKELITTQKTDLEYLTINSFIKIKNIYLNAGEYELKVTIYELSTKKYMTIEKKVLVEDYLIKRVTISDVLIIKRISESGGKRYVTPCVTRNVSDLDTFNVLFYVYRVSDTLPLSVSVKLLDKNKDILYSVEKSAEDTDEFENQFILPVPASKLTSGDYDLAINVTGADYTNSKTALVILQSSDIPQGLGSIDDLISQTVYIATGDEIDYMRKGKDDIEKTKRFIDFWKKKDPSPDTRKNEVLIEYYKRIKYAIDNFSSGYLAGWKTDMGMVFVYYGMPSSIERHPFESDTKPYEIWYYDTYSRSYVFVDETGFGDYRLTTPIWDTFRYRY